MSARRIDLSGQRFGRLTVVAFSHVKHGAHWLCRCSCGAESTVEGAKLRSGATQSCGCLMREHQKSHPVHSKHGHTPPSGPTATYRSWYAMIQRCTNPRNTSYSRYGGVGVTVCQRWAQSFVDFLADMGERPATSSLDRIDGAKGYEPANCRWASAREQRINQRPRLKSSYLQRGSTLRMELESIHDHRSDGGEV